MVFFQNEQYALPGLNAVLSTVENHFWYDRFENQIWSTENIDSAAADSGNTNYTHILRPGLLMGKVASSGKLKQWSPTATDGTQYIYGILGYGLGMQRNGAAVGRYVGYVMVGGYVRPQRLLIPGETSFGISGNANEYLIRAQLFPRIGMSDVLVGLPEWRNVMAVTADKTVTYAENATLFTNRGASGAVNFTLPAQPYKGLRYGFYVVADQNVTVTAASANTMIAFNDVDADAVAFSTSSEKVGGMIEVMGDGTSWLTKVSLGAETQTPTVTT